MSKTIVVAIKYLEPEWHYTLACLLKLKSPLVLIDRGGVGSLAEAINRGFKTINQQPAPGNEKPLYVWFVTNILFENDCLQKLEKAMDDTGYAAITPAFNSDHKHIQPMPMSPNGDGLGVIEGPFVEFTSAIVRIDVFNRFLLDEDMPYVGHDLDWGHRVLDAGYKTGVLHGSVIRHTYIRHSRYNHSITDIRKKMRKNADAPTEEKLISKYGAEWKKILKYGV